MVELKGDKGFNFILRDDFPGILNTVGSRENIDEEFVIYFDESALKGVEEYLSSDTSKELGGVLTGKAYCTSSGMKYIHIEGYIIATNTTASVSRLTFTHKTWEDINLKLEEDHEGRIILGWFHSHPGHTVFMSEYDVFIQQNFFDMEFMVAYVFDPTINERGFFYLKNDEVTKSGSFFISRIQSKDDDELNHYISVERTGSKKTVLQKIPNTRNRMKDIFLYLLIIVNIVLVIYSIVKISNVEQSMVDIDEMKSINVEVEKLRSDYSRINQRLENFIIETSIARDTVTTQTQDTTP